MTAHPMTAQIQTQGVLGAIVGDVIGSRYEFNRIKNKDFNLFPDGARYTDDTVCTLGNGAAMRVSPVVAISRTPQDVLDWAERSASVSHNHPEGIKGAQATAWAIHQALAGATKDSIREGLTTTFGYDVSSSVDSIRPSARFDETCQVSLPEAFVCFLDSTGYEDSVRNAVSLGADADTQAAIADSIAEAFYGGVPVDLATPALATLTPQLRDVFERWKEFIRSPSPS